MTQQTEQGAYELSLVGDGISVKKDVGHQLALQIVNLVLGANLVPPGRSTGEEASDSQAGLSIREFLDNVGAQSNAEKILAIGQYLSNEGAQGAFSRDDVRLQFRRAQEAMPANFPRDFSTALASGWIAEAHGEDDTYYVTKTGRDLLNEGLRSATRPARARSRRARRAKPSGGTKTPEADGPKSKSAAAPSKKARRRTKGPGAQTSLRDLCETNFLKTPRTIGQIRDHLEDTKVRKFAANELSGPLGKLVREGVLERKKNPNKVYEYELAR